MEKLFEKEQICVLSPVYFMAVVAAANDLVRKPNLFYSTNYAKKAWYWRFWPIKTRGYVLTGFKMKWPDKLPLPSEMGVRAEMAETIKMLNDMKMSPIETVFVSKDLYSIISQMDENACILEIDAYGTVNYNKHNEHGRFSSFCIRASRLINVLSDKEMRQIKSVDAFVTGME
jgi:hypothetical protein